MSRTLNKLTHKYQYLKIELEELEEDIDHFNSTFNSMFGKYFMDKASEFWVNEETGEVRKDKPGEESEKPSKPSQPERIKKVYKKLSTVVHPDKGGSSEEFFKVKNAYNEGDILELFATAAKYNIIFEHEPEDEVLLEGSIVKISDKISSHKNSLAYNFFNGPKEKRLGVISEIQRLYGTKFTEEEVKKFLEVTI